MKKLLIPFFLIIFFLAAFAFFSRSVPNKTADKSASESLDSVNRMNSKAKSVLCPSIRKGFVSSSSLFYRKRDSMLFTTLLLGQKELIAGLEDDEYWFWMPSFDAKTIYFCEMDRLDFTDLRLVMRPEIMEMMSWITEIDPLSPTHTSPRGHVATTASGPFEILVEFDSERILSQSAFLSAIPIVTFEGSDFSDFGGLNLPRRMTATWHEEKISHRFSIDRWVINADRPESMLPKGLKRVNLEDYSSSAVRFVSSSSSLPPDGRRSRSSSKAR